MVYFRLIAAMAAHTDTQQHACTCCKIAHSYGELVKLCTPLKSIGECADWRPIFYSLYAIARRRFEEIEQRGGRLGDQQCSCGAPAFPLNRAQLTIWKQWFLQPHTLDMPVFMFLRRRTGNDVALHMFSYL